jgi:hypothetical protein
LMLSNPYQSNPSNSKSLMFNETMDGHFVAINITDSYSPGAKLNVFKQGLCCY